MRIFRYIHRDFAGMSGVPEINARPADNSSSMFLDCASHVLLQNGMNGYSLRGQYLFISFMQTAIKLYVMRLGVSTGMRYRIVYG